jgi:chloramphenicol-sensitive protein RarD
MDARVSEFRRGFSQGVVAYTLWGLAPLFWKLLPGISPAELIAHRFVWGAVTFAALVRITGVWPAVRAGLRDRRTMTVMTLSGVLLIINWGTFVGAVATGHILEASLGYFINPLLSIALGTVLLRERLRRLQWVAIGLAAGGVAVLTWRAGELPWISLAVSISFGLYGLVRKLAPIDSLAGSAIETALITPIAIAYLVVLELCGGGQLGHAAAGTELLLVATGVVTAVPLLLFTSAARRLPLSTLGFLQYIGPTLQLLLAVLVYGEPFSRGQALAFSLIWLGLAAFSIDLARARPLSRSGR